MKEVVLCGFMLAGLAMAGPLRAEKYECLNIAHRAGASLGPENTYAALREARKYPIDGVEFDIRMTADGRGIVMHDDTTKRTAGGAEVKAVSLTLEQLGKLDAGAWWEDGRFAGERLPLPGGYIEKILAAGAAPVVELKDTGLEAETARILREQKAVERAWVISFNYGIMKTFADDYPGFRTAWLVDKKTFEDKSVAEVVAAASRVHCRGLSVQYGQLTPELMRACREAGLGVYVWTVDKPADMERLIRMGVDGITTNRPQDLAAVLKKLNA